MSDSTPQVATDLGLAKMTVVGTVGHDRFYVESWVSPAVQADQPMMHWYLEEQQRKLDEVAGAPVSVDIGAAGQPPVDRG